MTLMVYWQMESKIKRILPGILPFLVFPFFVSLCVADYMKSPTLSIVPYLDIQGLRYLPFNKATKVFAF